MGFYKKLNKFGRVVWVAELEECTDPSSVEISEQEYLTFSKLHNFENLETKIE